AKWYRRSLRWGSEIAWRATARWGSAVGGGSASKDLIKGCIRTDVAKLRLALGNSGCSPKVIYGPLPSEDCGPNGSAGSTSHSNCASYRVLASMHPELTLCRPDAHSLPS